MIDIFMSFTILLFFTFIYLMEIGFFSVLII